MMYHDVILQSMQDASEESAYAHGTIKFAGLKQGKSPPGGLEKAIQKFLEEGSNT